MFRTFLKSVQKYLRPAGFFQATVQIPAFRPITEGISDGPPLLARAFEGQSLGDFLTAIFNIAISVGAILAVLRIGYAGFVYMTTDVISDKSNSKTIIQNAVLGLLLLLAIILILERINPDILKVNFDLQPAGTQTAPAGAGSPFPSL
jgi:hypothetical protein